MPVFYNSLDEKTSLRNTADFQSCFMFSLLLPWLGVIKRISKFYEKNMLRKRALNIDQ